MCSSLAVVTNISADNMLVKMMPQIYSCTIHCVKWWMWNAGTTQIVTRGLVENKEISMDVWIKSGSFCLGHFWVWKFHLNSVMCRVLTSSNRGDQTAFYQSRPNNFFLNWVFLALKKLCLLSLLWTIENSGKNQKLVKLL